MGCLHSCGFKYIMSVSNDAVELKEDNSFELLINILAKDPEDGGEGGGGRLDSSDAMWQLRWSSDQRHIK